MAIVRLGGGVASASGSMGSVTFSRNRGGPYIRNRAIPTNPNTVFQQVIRALVAQLTNLWLNVLTAAQRAAWDVYAFNVPLPNALGEPRNVGGLGMYVRSNVPRLQTTLSRVDDAPLIFNLGDFTEPSIAVATPSSVSLAFDNTDAWANETGSAMLFYFGRPQNPSINFFKGPYRFTTSAAGDDTTPPTSPEVVSVVPFPLATDQVLHIRSQVSRLDGRLSTDVRTFRPVS